MRAELIFNAFLGVVLVFLLVNGLGLPASSNETDLLGARGFPIFLSILGLVVLVAITLRTLQVKREVLVPLFNPRTSDGRATMFSALWLLVYILMLDVTGFILTTLVYLPIAAWLIGYRNWSRLLMFSVAGTAVITIVFGMLFVVPLPRGTGQLYELSYEIY